MITEVDCHIKSCLKFWEQILTQDITNLQLLSHSRFGTPNHVTQAEHIIRANEE